MNAVKSDVEKLVQKELESANQKFPMFRSDHEGAAVIFEELQETEIEFQRTEDRFKDIWSFTKNNSYSEELVSDLKYCAISLACEAIQVAAMAQKFIDSKKERGKSE